MGVGMWGAESGWVGGVSGSEQRHRTQNRGRNGYTKMEAEMTGIWLVCTWAPHSRVDLATDNIDVAKIRNMSENRKRTISLRQQFLSSLQGVTFLPSPTFSPSNCLFSSSSTAFTLRNRPSIHASCVMTFTTLSIQPSIVYHSGSQMALGLCSALGHSPSSPLSSGQIAHG